LTLPLFTQPRLPTRRHLMLASLPASCQPREDQMRGVVFTGDRQLEMMEFPDPTPGDGEVVIEMKASGMCGSDLHQYRRQKGGEAIGGLPAATEPVIAGHEPGGIGAAIGPGVPAARARIGERVMVHHSEGLPVCN